MFQHMILKPGHRAVVVKLLGGGMIQTLLANVSSTGFLLLLPVHFWWYVLLGACALSPYVIVPIGVIVVGV